MSEDDRPRRVIAEIRFGADPMGIPQIGSRSIHHFWQLLAPAFQGIFLPPQRRPDDSGVAWSWSESPGGKAVTPAELAELRERLGAAGRAFAKDLEGSELGSEIFGGLSPKDGVKQLRSKVNDMVAKLAGKPDARLAPFVCRTEAGVRMHSWGASVAAQPFYPDARDCEVSGTVLVNEKGAPDFEVVIESRTGVRLGRTRSDGDGRFRLEKIGPGTHRVRVLSDRVDFPVSGVMVTVERTSISNLELRSTSGTVAARMLAAEGAAAPSGRPVALFEDADRGNAKSGRRSSSRRRWGWGAVIVVGLLLSAGAGWWLWSGSRPDALHPGLVGQGSTFSGGRSIAQGKAGQPPSGSRMADMGRASAAVPASHPAEPQRPDSGAPALNPGGAANDSAQISPPSKTANGEKAALGETSPASHFQPQKSLQNAKGEPDKEAQASSAVPHAPGDASRKADNSEVAGQEKPVEPDKAHRAAPEAKKAKEGSPSPARPSNAAPKVEVADSSSSEIAQDAPEDGGQSHDRPAGARATTGGAKSRKVSHQDAHPAGDATGTPADDGDEVSGESAPGGGTGGATEGKSGHAASAEGAGRKSLSFAAPPAGHGTPMAADETPDHETASDPGAGGLQEAPSPEKGSHAPSMNTASASTASPGESAASAEESASEQSDFERPESPGRQSAMPKAASAPKEKEHYPQAATAASADSNSSGAAETADSRSDDKSGESSKSKSSPAKKEPAHSASPKPAESPADRPAEAKSGAPGARPEPALPEAGAALARVSQEALHGAARPSGAGVRLSRRASLRASSWRRQLVRDEILPTVPEQSGESDSIEQLREHYLQAEENRIPASFRNAVLRNGLTVEVSKSELAAGPLHWSCGNGKEIRGASAAGARAEIAWSGGIPPSGGQYVLCSGGGQILAVIAADSGRIDVKAAENVHCWYWFAVEMSAGDSAEIAKGASERFEWKTSDGAILPDSSKAEAPSRKAQMLRVDLPVDLRNGAADKGAIPVLLVDRKTGWAIGSQIEEVPGSAAVP